MTRRSAKSDWARDYFERGYAQRWGLPPLSDHVRQEVGGLWNLLHLEQGSHVIDVGCGHGRHALALVERGAEVTGVDFAGALLGRARHLAANQARPRWIRGDMRRLPLRSACAEAVISLDAFGFFETEAENEAVLREAARVQTTGGRLALKMVNGHQIIDTFREADREERDGTVVTISRTLTLGPARMTEIISVSGSRGHGEYERRQRLYHAEELRAMLEGVAFSSIGVFASPDGAPFEATASAAMWIIAQR